MGRQTQQADGDTLDEQFTTGIWYDVTSGDFFQLRETSSGDVALYSPEADPEEDSDLFVVPAEDWGPRQIGDFYQVDEHAIKEPVHTYINVENPSRLMLDEYANYAWADKVTTIETTDDYTPDKYL